MGACAAGFMWYRKTVWPPFTTFVEVSFRSRKAQWKIGNTRNRKHQFDGVGRMLRTEDEKRWVLVSDYPFFLGCTISVRPSHSSRPIYNMDDACVGPVR